MYWSTDDAAHTRGTCLFDVLSRVVRSDTDLSSCLVSSASETAGIAGIAVDTMTNQITSWPGVPPDGLCDARHRAVGRR